MKAGDFEYSYKGPNDSVAARKKAAGPKEVSEKPAAQVTDEITDEFLNDPSSPIPDLGGNNEGVESDEDDEDDDDLNSEDADSEDDPNKLWCICQQPHNNKFMICCDSCLDWFHGKCVGITKKMGKEMEEAGNEWACPKCKSKEEKESTNQLKDKLKERQQTKSKAEIAPSEKVPTPPKAGDKPKAKQRRSLSKEKDTVEVKKVKDCLDFFEINETSLKPFVVFIKIDYFAYEIRIVISG